MTTGHDLSIERGTIATEIEDLVVLSIEAIIIGMTVIVGLAIEAISIMVTGVAAHPLGNMVMATITVVIQITAEVEVTHQVDIKEDRVTNVTIIIIEADSHRVRIETNIGNRIDMKITTSHILKEMIMSMVVSQGEVVVMMVQDCQI